MPDLSKFAEWVKAGNGERHVKIDLGEIGHKDYIKIWVNDYELEVGQFVNSADEINLEAAKENQEKEEYERLKAKYGDKK